jgi:hypothetical protein
MRLLAAFLLVALLPQPAVDRFTPIIASAPESSVRNGYVVNHRREAVEKEITTRPPTREELGVELPPGARLDRNNSARQIVQYHPVWRVYDYRLTTPVARAELLAFFARQGVTYDQNQQWLVFTGKGGNGEDFIDQISGDPITRFRIWRKPPAK